MMWAFYQEEKWGKGTSNRDDSIENGQRQKTMAEGGRNMAHLQICEISVSWLSLFSSFYLHSYW